MILGNSVCLYVTEIETLCLQWQIACLLLLSLLRIIRNAGICTIMFKSHDQWLNVLLRTTLSGKFHGQRSLVGYRVHGVAMGQTWLSDWEPSCIHTHTHTHTHLVTYLKLLSTFQYSYAWLFWSTEMLEEIGYFVELIFIYLSLLIKSSPEST